KTVSVQEITARRAKFQQPFRQLYIDKITATGINKYQESYVKDIINYNNECLSINQIKPSYFRLITDNNIKSVFPVLKYNDTTGYFDLDMLIKQETDLKLDFGGNISSSPINEAYVGLQYKYWRKQALIANANIYFGKLYNSASLRLR